MIQLLCIVWQNAIKEEDRKQSVRKLQQKLITNLTLGLVRSLSSL